MSVGEPSSPAAGGAARVAAAPAAAGPGPRGQGVERAVARVDLRAIERNCAHLRSLLESRSELCAVVKADGYGHGAAQAARAAQAGGATWLAVAAGGEARDLRRLGVSGRTLVMGALTGPDARAAAEADADVVAWTDRFVDELRGVAAGAARPLRVHVKLDTGMGRLGTKDVRQALALCDRVARDDRLELAGVMTHFATADEPGDDHFPAQLQAFQQFVASVRAAHPGVLVHAANSAAVYREPGSHFDMVRCGVAVYGLDPFQGDAEARELRPALELSSYVADVKRFRPGESAGYGRRWAAERETWVGVLPIGYGDGVRRALSDNCDVLVRGRRHPLVGTVSMDNLTVDLGPQPDVRPGDEAVLIGTRGRERITAEEMASRLATINYEVTCGIGPRVTRRYTEP
jgi:alanine racemase